MKARGKKMGTQIMETVLAACDELDITNLVCLIFGHNAPSIGLMKKFGFEQWGYCREPNSTASSAISSTWAKESATDFSNVYIACDLR